MRSRGLPFLMAILMFSAVTVSIGPLASEVQAQRRRPSQRRTAPQREQVPQRYYAVPRQYYFPPIDVTLGFYYHPYFGFYYGPYYGAYYPYPGPFLGASRYSTSAVRTKVKPVETEVYVNGYYAGIVDDFDGVFQRLYLPAGEHEIELRLDGYSSFRRKIYLSPGDTFEVKHQMEPRGPGETNDPSPEPRELPKEWTGTEAIVDPPPGLDRAASPYGILAIRVQPDHAEVLIDGEPWSVTEGLPELAIHLPAGRHRIEIRKEGFQSFVTEVELHEGQTIPLSVKLAARNSEAPGASGLLTDPAIARQSATKLSSVTRTNTSGSSLTRLTVSGVPAPPALSDHDETTESGFAGNLYRRYVSQRGGVGDSY